MISKSHSWSVEVHGFQISPYLQELQAYAGQDDNFQLASDRLSKYLRISTNSTQIDRVVKHYGAQLEVENVPSSCSKAEAIVPQASSLKANEVVYSMIDGSMLLTREKSDWKEMKLGRLFHSGTHYEVSKDRNWIKDSTYMAHFGYYGDFLEKFEPMVDQYESIGQRLVFVNDGAQWIWNWVKEKYPQSTQILDYYHAAEYLGNFAKAYFPTKDQRTQWLAQQKDLLLSDQVEAVITQIQGLESKTQAKKDAQAKILTYYRNNQARMKYQTYQQKGLLIGSGPIEAAHRNVIQKRLKQSGQRWTIKGAQYVANLRVANMSGKWKQVVDFIKSAA